MAKASGRPFDIYGGEIVVKAEGDAMFETEVARALDEGELVGIFPEGSITATGELNPFRPGVTRILERNPVPIIPLALQGLWGSFFSRKGGPAMSKPFRRPLFSKIAVVGANPVAPEQATPANLQEIVGHLRGDWK